MKTLPQIAQEHRVSLDVLRALVRRCPDLRAMGHRYGPTRVYDAGEVEKIRAAWASRKTRSEKASA